MTALGCHTEVVTGTQWCVVHASDWPSDRKFCRVKDAADADLAQRAALERTLDHLPRRS